MDLRKYRVTYWPQNSRMGLPKATKPVMEAELVTKKTKYRECFNRYLMEFCNSNGDQRVNLTRKQMLGLKSLKERIRRQEIVILKSDKSGKLVAVGPVEYLTIGCCSCRR